jgi:hypothetical protein
MKWQCKTYKEGNMKEVNKLLREAEKEGT